MKLITNKVFISKSNVLGHSLGDMVTIHPCQVKALRQKFKL